MDSETDFLFPFKPGDWVMDELGRVAKVKKIDYIAGELTFDLIIYAHSGEKIGRESPVMGGPRTFEPCCSTEGWERCEEPDFPMRPEWVVQPDGSKRLMYWSERLPPANWKKPKRRTPKMTFPTPTAQESAFRQALETIADGYNDPRQLARAALGRPQLTR